jgi:hypothetical protein
LPQRKPTSTRTETIFTGQGGLDKYENYTPTDEDIDEVLFDNET